MVSIANAFFHSLRTVISFWRMKVVNNCVRKLFYFRINFRKSNSIKNSYIRVSCCRCGRPKDGHKELGTEQRGQGIDNRDCLWRCSPLKNLSAIMVAAGLISIGALLTRWGWLFIIPSVIYFLQVQYSHSSFSHPFFLLLAPLHLPSFFSYPRSSCYPLTHPSHPGAKRPLQIIFEFIRQILGAVFF